MPKGSFRKGWIDVAAQQRLPKRLLMWSIAGNDQIMGELEAEAGKLADEKKQGALPWAEIISLLLPILLKILQERLKP